MSKKYHELEIKLDALTDAEIMAAQQWVETTPEIFSKRKSVAPPAMQGLFQRAKQVTDERIRVYFDTADLKAMRHGIEIRQETIEKGGVKQMVKIGASVKTVHPVMNSSVMDRMEHPCELDAFGVDFDQIDDKATRSRLRRIFDEDELKPLIAMVSQRTRIKYHPEGNRNILIEAAFDYPCWGFACDGFRWQAPEMELEMLKGPDDTAQARAILEAESARFQKKFGFERMVTSKPTPGFVSLAKFLQTARGAQVFEAIDIERPWWMLADMKADFQYAKANHSNTKVASDPNPR